MFKQLIAALHPMMVANSAGASAGPAHTPYESPAINQIYNLLFCDNPGAFAPRTGQDAAAWQSTLFAPDTAPQALRALAANPAEASRVRALAYGRLQAMGQPVPARQLLGVVLEVPLEGGLDVLAAYVDGSVRYINHTGRPAVFEGPVPPLAPTVQRLLAAGQSIVDRIGPWDKARLPAPTQNVRMSFLVSDGLYFGEGPMAAMSGDALAGPLLQAGGELLAQVVDMALA